MWGVAPSGSRSRAGLNARLEVEEGSLMHLMTSEPVLGQ